MEGNEETEEKYGWGWQLQRKEALGAGQVGEVETEGRVMGREVGSEGRGLGSSGEVGNEKPRGKWELVGGRCGRGDWVWDRVAGVRIPR